MCVCVCVCVCEPHPQPADWRNNTVVVSLMRDAAATHNVPYPSSGDDSALVLYDALASRRLLPPGVPYIASDGWFSHPVDTLPGACARAHVPWVGGWVLVPLGG